MGQVWEDGVVVPHQETLAEHRANAITHAVGVLLSLVALVVLIVLSVSGGDARRVVTLTIYGVTLVAVYAASALYHSVGPDTALRRRFMIWDHAAIYGLIAGTYTPFLLVLVRGAWGWSLFGVLWGLAIVGGVLKIFFVGRFNLLSTLIYLMMGWIGVVAIKPFLATIPGGALLWLLAGGIAYTAGVVFYLWERLRFSHAIWHVFALGGSICHFCALLFYVVPKTLS